MLPPQLSPNYLLIIFTCYLSFFLVFFVFYSLTSSICLSVRYPINHRGLCKLSVKLNHVPYGWSSPSQQSGASSYRESDLYHHHNCNTSCHHDILVPAFAQNIFFCNGEPAATYVATTLHYRIKYFMKIFLFVVHNYLSTVSEDVSSVIVESVQEITWDANLIIPLKVILGENVNVVLPVLRP